MHCDSIEIDVARMISTASIVSITAVIGADWRLEILGIFSSESLSVAVSLQCLSLMTA